MFFCLLEETSLIFVSKDIDFSSSLCQIMHNLLKPFRWSFPYIYNLPLKMSEFLNSPIPLIIGYN